ncbi:recombinase family protein [Roseomonas sp. KE2513]|nr:recombinase family protein [Roseomonas sp. KE2513]
MATPGADDLIMRVYAAMAQKERELISARTRAVLAAARDRETVLGGDRGWLQPSPPCAAAAAHVRQEEANRTAHRLTLELEALREKGSRPTPK